MRTMIGQRNDDKGEIVKFRAVTFTSIPIYWIYFDKVKRKFSRKEPIYFTLNWLHRSSEYAKALTYVILANKLSSLII